MRRFFLAAIAPLFLLAACAAPGSSSQPVQITRAQVAEGALLAAIVPLLLLGEGGVVSVIKRLLGG